jgi:hypothetical protein
MQIPSVTIGIKHDGSVEVYHASVDKSEAIKVAKDKANEPGADVAEIRVVCAIGSGTAWRRRIRAAAPAPAQEEEAGDADVKAIRAALKEKGVQLPPRIGVDKLLDLAVKHGVEV